jgi:hypothetical protein
MTLTFNQFCELERTLSHVNRLRYARHYELGYETLSADGVAVAGVDGWLFIADGSNHWEGQYTGEFHLTESGLADWLKAFERRQHVSELIGAQFVHLVIPEKQSVLTNARWVNRVTMHSPRPVLQIQNGLAARQSLLVYPAQAMISESYYAELYFRGDSHCCVSGTWLYFLEVAKRIWSNKSFDFALVPLRRSWIKQDLLAKYAQGIYEEAIMIARHAQVVFDNQLAKNMGAQVGNHYILHNPKAPYSETVIIYGDSYSFDMGFSDVVSVFFEYVHFVWGTVVDFNYCKHHGINYVIVQSAERFLARVHAQDIFNAE